MAKTVTITKQSQNRLQRKFKQHGAIQECINQTKVSRNTIRDLIRLGIASEDTIEKISPYTGKIEIKEAE